jgi:hypothetical protein
MCGWAFARGGNTVTPHQEVSGATAHQTRHPPTRAESQRSGTFRWRRPGRNLRRRHRAIEGGSPRRDGGGQARLRNSGCCPRQGGDERLSDTVLHDPAGLLYERDPEVPRLEVLTDRDLAGHGGGRPGGQKRPSRCRAARSHPAHGSGSPPPAVAQQPARAGIRAIARDDERASRDERRLLNRLASGGHSVRCAALHGRAPSTPLSALLGAPTIKPCVLSATAGSKSSITCSPHTSVATKPSTCATAPTFNQPLQTEC